MANNISVKNATGSSVTLKTTDTGGVHTTHHNVDSLPANPFGANADAAATTDDSATISAKLRGLIKWAFERMPASLGRKTAAASLPVTLSSDDPLPTILSTVNSTSTVLGGGATFTGTAEDVSKFRSVVVNAYASHASASNGLKLQFSSDGTNWDIERAFTLAADDGEHYISPVLARYFRVVYTNGATLQTSFRLQTIVHPTLAGFPTVIADGQQALSISSGQLPAALNGSGNFKTAVAEALPAGTATIGLVGIATQTSGGDSVYLNINLGTAANVKASAGQVYGWYFANRSSEWRYIKLYNKASAPTLGTDTPVFVIAVSPGAPGHVEIVRGIQFTLGIGIAATTGLAHADTTLPNTNDVIMNLLYQ